MKATAEGTVSGRRPAPSMRQPGGGNVVPVSQWESLGAVTVRVLSNLLSEGRLNEQAITKP